MAYNSNDQRTLPGQLQGVTSQNGGNNSSLAVANALASQAIQNENLNEVVAPGNPAPGYKTPGNLAVAQPQGANVMVVPNSDSSGATGANLQLVGSPAGSLSGGGGIYPNIAGASAVPNPFVASGWSAQGNTPEDAQAQAGVTITTPSLAGGTRNVAYGPVTLNASGGTGPYSWVADAGLPAGMTLSGGGSLAGTPAAALAAGTYVIEFTATDTLGHFASKALSVVLA